MSALENIAFSSRTTGNQQIEVTVRHSELEKKIVGPPEAVLRELLTYISSVYPTLDLISRIVLSVDSKEFLESCAGTLGVTPEGIVVLKDVAGLRDRELLMLYLAGARLMHLLGKKDADAITLEELTRVMGRPTGTVAGRLSELWKEQLIERVGKGSYRLTTMGQRIVVRTLMPKLANVPERKQ